MLVPSSQAARGAPLGLPLTSTYPRILLTMNILSNPVAYIYINYKHEQTVTIGMHANLNKHSYVRT